jgi:putative ABC transport system substrate-binding protein
MKKILIPVVVVVLVAILVLVFSTPTERSRTVGVITFVDHPVLNTIHNSFKEELERLAGENHEVRFLTLNALGRVENLQRISKNLLNRKPEIVVTISTPVSQALMREADTRQKVVYTFVTNPADLGDELTRTNSTGLSDAVNYAGNIELIRRIFGEKTRVGMLYNPNESNSVHGINAVEAILARSDSEMKMIKASVVKESDIPVVVSRLAMQVDVIYVGGDNTVVGAMPVVLNEALRKGVPVFASDEGSIESGAIAGVSVNYVKLGAETAKVVKSVLDGKEPREIPRITMRGDKLMINKIAAKRWELEIPSTILNEADEIIE